MVVGANCQGNTEECQGNLWEWVQTAREMHVKQENARGTYGSGCIVPGECRGIRGECSGIRGECRGLLGECKGVGVKC